MISTSGGSARQMSTSTTIRKFAGLNWNERPRARRSPVDRPVTTTSAASSRVTTSPSSISGRYWSMIGTLKKLCANCSIGGRSAPQ